MRLESDGVTAARGDRLLFSELSFRVDAGAALWIKGDNGSGKTTLLRLLCGLAIPHDGEVRWRGQPVRRLREAYHGELLYLGHAGAIKDDLSARENLVASATLGGRPVSRAQADAALDAVGLSAQAHLPGRVLSQGQRRRVALARLHLAPLPPLLLLDEPFSALDAGSVEQLCGTLTGHLENGGTLVYSTHQSVALAAAQLDLSAASAC